jgi:uncharacterized membrane protein
MQIRQKPVIKYVLAASLAVNLVLGGLFVAWKVESGHRKEGFRIESALERIAAKLPKADGEALKTALQADRNALLEQRAAVREAHEAIRAALQAEPFDAAALEQAFERSHAARQAMAAAVEHVIIAAAPTMSHEGRSELSNWRKHR